MDAIAERYSHQLSQNILRGMDYNTQNAMFNGYKGSGAAWAGAGERKSTS